MKHRVLKQALATVALLLCSMVAMAQTTATVDGITYEFITKGKLATVVESESGYSGDIVIPEIVGYDGVAYSVTAIGYAAFSSCGRLKSVTIPNSVTTIGEKAFSSCTGLTAVHISDLSAWCNINFANGKANPLNYNAKLYINKELVTDLVISIDVTEIKDYAFYGCSGLTSVIIPNSVTTIGEQAFGYCTDLTSVTIGNGVTTIGGSAFYDCTRLTNVTIGNSVTTIGNNAFYDCSALTNVTIPNSVTTIEEDAFGYCTGLTSVTIPNSVTKIEDYTFDGCTGLTNVTIPNSVTTIGDYAFRNCSALTSVTIPNSVNTIGMAAFDGCISLENVNIGDGVTKIEMYAFDGFTNLETVVIGRGIKVIEYTFARCGNLTDVYCLATSVPTTNSNAFENSYIEYATLHVPEESIDSYRRTAPWSGFGTIKAIDGDIPGTQTPVTPKCATPVITYSAGKLSIACNTEGAQFVTTITDSDIRTHYDSEIGLTVTYNITTYATLAGYENSDTIQATLCWIDSTPTMEQVGTDVTEIASTPVLVRSSDGNIFVSGASEGTAIRVYSMDGMSVGSAVSNTGETTVPTTLQKGKTAIVAIGDSRIKMVMR